MKYLTTGGWKKFFWLPLIESRVTVTVTITVLLMWGGELEVELYEYISE